MVTKYIQVFIYLFIYFSQGVLIASYAEKVQLKMEVYVGLTKLRL